MSEVLHASQTGSGPGAPNGLAPEARPLDAAAPVAVAVEGLALDAGAPAQASASDGGRLAIKRAIDVVIASVGLVALAPFGLLIAVAVRISSPGSVIFRQTRVGRHGVTFRMFKFRTMIDGAELGRAELEVLNESEGIFKLRNDPRMTGIGRLLRRGSLDELPQLLNVLRGEMSLVGPRPLVPEEDRRIQGPYRARLRLRPGMTGPWQALGPIRPTLRDMVVIDCLYVENWSLWMDFRVLLQTFAHVARLRGI